MIAKILVTHEIPDKGILMLQEKYDIEYRKTVGVISKTELIGMLKDKNIVLSLLSDTFDEEVFRNCPDLKMVSNYAVGFNNIDLKAATRYGVYVTNTPKTLDETTVDFTFALMLAVARRVVESDKFLRSGKFTGWGAMEFLGGEVNRSTLGIIGLGNIGKSLGRRAYYGFNMKVLYMDKFVREDTLDFPAQSVNMETLLKESDFISLHVPLTDETKHLIGEKELNMMKSTAYLINTSRGPVVHEAALYKVLKENKIAGAGLDVYEFEPAFHKGLEELDNIVMCPHIASASLNTRQNMSIKAAQNIIDFVEGRIPEGLVNREVLK
ncbi:D-glycerate dehydrogenase [Ignavibacteria bacterium CHB1]|nr:MAG: D-glycerate dehydrogenase [Chlorobiota bacterium]MBV6399644.1 putative 2-hydroxyacid dehydrogenase [Ignavibacteria bacterium]MCC6885636.1 D-glycerate dehydrogenase [Ignavibacteriales bacterium]MCE7953800.1 D-glycerate dehydrogenase [Chlorobi bacterium CHB7]MDL1887734.1 D-glycerate dehydrogenase [Ignavibacteria bacterium CHB1]RIK48283.1 MAG: D-glycerate dehydrogenase [Ignavibacteriota bacterium]